MQKNKKAPQWDAFRMNIFRDNYFLQLFSSETVSFLRPFFLRAANTLRPLAVAILLRKPCLFLRLRNEG